MQFVILASKKNDENQKRKKKMEHNVKTNIWKTFLQPLSKHFAKDHQMHKIFIKDKVKISYSCMKNTISVLSIHNKNMLNPKQTTFGCNCRNKDNSPINGECLTPNTKYLPDITTDSSDHKFYCGTSVITFNQLYVWLKTRQVPKFYWTC